MIKTWKCVLKKKLSSREYQYLREICRLSKSVYNTALYNVRQYYFENKKYLSYYQNFKLMKNDKVYQRLGGNVSQQTMREVEHNFSSFFELLKIAEPGQKVGIPHYMPKDGLREVVFAHAGEADLSNGYFKVPISRMLAKKYQKFKMHIRVPDYVKNKIVKQIRIYPKCNGKYFEAHFIFEDVENQKQELNNELGLGIDLGVNNFATCASNSGDSFIIDGRKIKSINQWYNKEQARLSSIKDHQKFGKQWTKRQHQIAYKRNKQIQNFIYLSSKYIVKYCLQNKIGKIVLGWNQGIKQEIELGKSNNQNFVQIPYYNFRQRLSYLCQVHGIEYIEQEESYTSKASFFDNDEMPVYSEGDQSEKIFSGTRITRGCYRRKDGKLINADVNAALNILRKSKVMSLQALYHRGCVIQPMRIRLA